MDINEITGGTVGSVSFAAAAAVNSLLPLCAELDVFIGAQIGPLIADLQAQYRASLDFSVNASLALINPFQIIQDVLRAVIQLQASLQASLALPAIGLGVNANITAAATLAAALEIRLGLLNAAIKALIALKIGALNLAGIIAGKLSAGPVVLLEFGALGASTLAVAGTDIATKFGSGLTLGGGISPVDISFGYILVTKAPVAKAGLDFVLRGI